MFRQAQATPARYQDMRPHKIPEPPLNPYMQFSRKFWHKARQENLERPLWEISRIVGQMWKDLSESERNEYQLRYEHEKKRITEEMIRAEESFKQRKRAIEEDSEKFEVALKKASDMRPKVDEEFYNNMVEEASKKLLEQWEAYQKRQEVLNQQKEAEQKSTPILYSLTVSPNFENKGINGDVTATIPENSEEKAMETEEPNNDSEVISTVAESDNQPPAQVNGENETTSDGTAPSENSEIPMETSNDASDTQQQNENNV
uniref:HMG box domain-containing protein n=1 Tax=Panagrolaimus sp. ES5 TaxID=591445 RepID=A0AC34FK61_9BILA